MVDLLFGRQMKHGNVNKSSLNGEGERKAPSGVDRSGRLLPCLWVREVVADDL